MKHRGLGFAVSVPLLMAACAGAPQPPTLDEATATLNQLVTYAVSGDFEALCSIGDGNCRSRLEEVGTRSAPSAAPIVTGSDVIEPDRSTGSMGGRVLGLCGTDGLGNPYRSEILVFRDGGQMRVINPVFWDGTGIGRSGTAAAPAVAAPTGCP